MSNDSFKQVNINIGQEVRAVDLTNISRMVDARLFDQVLASVGPNFGEADFFDLPGHVGTDIALTPYAYALTPGGAYLRQGSANDKVQIAPGTLFQKVAAADGLDAQMIPFTFLGTEEWTVPAGDATNPRVDLLQIKLEWETGGAETRVFKIAAIPASIDTSTVSANADSVFQARADGAGGDNITLTYVKRSSGSGVTVSEAGWTVTVQYEDGVSTNLDVETAIDATSTLIETQTPGTPATVLVDPGDSFGPVSLTGGADSVLTSSSQNMQRRVKCTMLVKTGTPAASPAYPDPDAGYVVVGAIVVGATYAAASGVLFEDTAGAVAVVHDQRMPLNIKRRVTPVSAMQYDNGTPHWTETSNMSMLQATGGAGRILYIPHVGPHGRLVAAKNDLYDAAAVTSSFVKRKYESAGVGLGITVSETNLNSGYANGSSSSNFAQRTASFANIQSTSTPAAGPTVTANANGMGPPIWTNGKRAMQPDNTTFPAPHESLMLKLTAAGGVIVGPYTFFIAEGI